METRLIRGLSVCYENGRAQGRGGSGQVIAAGKGIQLILVDLDQHNGGIS